MKTESDWTTPADAKAEVQRLWDRGRLLAPDSAGLPPFPLKLTLRRPGSRTLLNEFDRVRDWIKALEAGARSATGSGYDIVWVDVDYRQLGKNRVPDGLVVPTHEDALRSIGKLRQAERFSALANATLARFPSLRDWLGKKPLLALDHAQDWERVLAVLGWFSDHPRAGVYLRQIDVAGVDTKFIESHRGLLIELLDRVLPFESVNRTAGRRFEARYGLLSKPPLVRLRMLDADRRIGGLSDISTPVSELAGVEPPVERIFITENEVNGLAFPPMPDSAVIFGLGYALEPLSELPWLGRKELHYWGDIDTHGFAILDRLRASFPGARSLLMDRGTLLRHRSLWVEESARHLGPLARLSPAEADLYADLAADRIGPSVRLEQERIGFAWVEAALAGLLSG